MAISNTLAVTNVRNKAQLIIESQIINGTYKDGEKLPSIKELSESMEISIKTAQRVFENLCADKIITNKHGIGYYVLPNVRSSLKSKHIKYIRVQIDNIVDLIKPLELDDNNLAEFERYFSTALRTLKK